MAEIFTRRLVAAQLATAGLTHLYTAPRGQTTIIRDIVATPLGGSPGQFGIYIQVPGGSFFWVLLVAAPPTTTSTHLDLRQELLADEELWVQTANPCTVLVTGYNFVT